MAPLKTDVLHFQYRNTHRDRTCQNGTTSRRARNAVTVPHWVLMVLIYCSKMIDEGPQLWTLGSNPQTLNPRP